MRIDFGCKKYIAGMLLFIICLLFCAGCGEETPKDVLVKCEMPQNTFPTLCVPTQFTKIGDDYFIVDCYHDQVITSTDPKAPLTEWRVLTSDIDKGHSIAGDGEVYLVDDTEGNRILVFAKDEDGEFCLAQSFDNIGSRPHFISYDESRGLFYVLSSITGEFYLFRRERDSLHVRQEKVCRIDEIDGIYVRSFSFIDDKLYLPAGNGNIYIVDPDSFEVEKAVTISPEIGGPVQISRIGEYYYLTVSTDIIGFADKATIVRAKSLEQFGDSFGMYGTDEFESATYERVKDMFCEDGTPYVISEVDGHYYIAWHSDYASHCMWEFTVDKNGAIDSISSVFTD